MVHLVYCDNQGKAGERELDKILSKQKTMVLRGAAGRKIPHSRVFEGETLYFMEKGSASISAKATVTHVDYFIKLQDDEIHQVMEENQEALQFSEKQKVRWHKKCLCLVSFDHVEEISPLAFDHQGNMDDWIILERIEDAVVGSSKPYNYDLAKFK